MGKNVLDTNGNPVTVIRKGGYLYYVDGKGNVMEAEMLRGKGKGKKSK